MLERVRLGFAERNAHLIVFCQHLTLALQRPSYAYNRFLSLSPIHHRGVPLVTMLFLNVFLLFSHAFAQSLVQREESITRSNTCLRRSVLLYTSNAETWTITDLGSTSFPAAPTLCPNVSVSTSVVYGSNRTVTRALPASTVTITEQSSATGVPAGSSGSMVIGFDDGTGNPLNGTSSSPQVSAAVAQSGPLQPYSGDSYL